VYIRNGAEREKRRRGLGFGSVSGQKRLSFGHPFPSPLYPILEGVL